MPCPRRLSPREPRRYHGGAGRRARPSNPRKSSPVGTLTADEGNHPFRRQGLALLSPSPRGELEITSVNQSYLDRGDLKVVEIGRGAARPDTGSPDNLLAASVFVQVLEQRQGIKVSCPWEIAWRRGFIDTGKLLAEAARVGGDYGDYLVRLARAGRTANPGPQRIGAGDLSPAARPSITDRS